MALVKLAPVSICPAYDVGEVRENVRISLKRRHLRLHQLPEFMKSKAGEPIALAGGGPSIRDHVSELKKFRAVMSAGSAHDWVVSQGIRAKYCIVVDAHSTVTSSYLQHPDPETTYLVATHCPEPVFKALEGFPVVMWHCISEGEREFLETVDPGYQGLGGGCTSGMRAIGMAAVLGYKNLHFFGYDSCLPESGESHAYPLQDEKTEMEGLRGKVDKIFNIRVGLGEPGEKSYNCFGYQLAQAQNFEELIGHHHKLFDCTFHGEGLLADIYKVLMDNMALEKAA